VTDLSAWLELLGQQRVTFPLALTAKAALLTMPLHLAAGLSLGAYLAERSRFAASLKWP